MALELNVVCLECGGGTCATHLASICCVWLLPIRAGLEFTVDESW